MSSQVWSHKLACEDNLCFCESVCVCMCVCAGLQHQLNSSGFKMLSTYLGSQNLDLL